eukprot:759364-Hanusia_phi.AAC.1
MKASLQEILSRCEVLDKALAEMAKNQTKHIEQLTEVRAKVERVDKQVQTVEENVSYSADVSSRVRCCCVGTGVTCSLAGSQMSKAIKELLAERKKMIQVMETLIASAREHAKRAQETEKQETEHKSVQTDPISFSTKETGVRQVRSAAFLEQDSRSGHLSQGDSDPMAAEAEAAADSTTKV